MGLCRANVTGIAWARRTWPDQRREALAAEYARDGVMPATLKYDHVKMGALSDQEDDELMTMVGRSKE